MASKSRFGSKCMLNLYNNLVSTKALKCTTSSSLLMMIMVKLEIKCSSPRIMYVSASPSVTSVGCVFVCCAAAIVLLIQCEERCWTTVMTAAGLPLLGLSLLNDWEDAVVDLVSRRLLLCRRGWLEKLVTHTGQTTQIQLSKVSSVCLMGCGRDVFGQVRITPCLRLDTREPEPLFGQSFPASMRSDLEALLERLTLFIGLRRLQSVTTASSEPDLDLDRLTLDCEPVTTLESVSVKLSRLMRQKSPDDTVAL